jgi:hypothetical protein
MADIFVDELTLAGFISIDSGQAIVGDPCYLDEWDTNKNEEWNIDGKVHEYSYHGASATTLADGFGQLGNGKAVAFNTGYGDGSYPVYVLTDNDGRVSKVVIDFFGDIEGDNTLNQLLDL